MIDFSLLPQSAVLPVDCHIGEGATMHAALPVTNVVDNLPPLPPKSIVIDNWPPPPKFNVIDNYPPLPPKIAVGDNYPPLPPKK